MHVRIAEGQTPNVKLDALKGGVECNLLDRQLKAVSGNATQERQPVRETAWVVVVVRSIDAGVRVCAIQKARTRTNACRSAVLEGEVVDLKMRRTSCDLGNSMRFL